VITEINPVALAEAIQDKSPAQAAWLRHLAPSVMEKKQ
jgi:hypothetical protein